MGADILYNYKEVCIFMHSGGVSTLRLRSTFLNFSPKSLFVVIKEAATSLLVVINEAATSLLVMINEAASKRGTPFP